MRPGDVIVEFNGRKVENDRGLVDMVVATRPGTSVPVKIVRDKQAKTLNVTVGELNLDQEAETPGRGIRGSVARLRPARSRT